MIRAVRQPGHETVAGWAAGSIALLIAAAIAWRMSDRIDQVTVALVVLLFLGSLAVLRPVTAIVATLVFLAVLGDFRRIVLFAAEPDRYDPILLVAPAVTFLLVAVGLVGNRLSASSTTARLVIALTAMTVVEAFNPLQGSVAVGIAGAMFFLIPLLWFWIGQSWGDPELLRFILTRVIVAVATAAALLGIYQTCFGFLPFEEEWVRRSGYTALNLYGGTRSFSFFTSSAEYGDFVAAAVVILCAYAAVERRPRWLLPVPVLCAGFVLQGSRGTVVMAVGAALVLWAVLHHGRSLVLRLVAAAVIVLPASFWVLSHAQDVRVPARVAAAIDHQSEGLLHPLDPDRSTAGLHLQMMVDGVTSGLTTPLGRGVGATTVAAKFGEQSAGTEVDFSDVFVSFGIIGGIAYLALIWKVYSTAFRRWGRVRDATTLAAIGFLLVLFGHWLHGGYYATSAIAFFLMGAVEREVRRVPASELFPSELPQGLCA